MGFSIISKGEHNRFAHFASLFVNITFVFIIASSIIVKISYPFLELSLSTYSQILEFFGTGFFVIIAFFLLAFALSEKAAKFQRFILRVKYTNLVLFLFIIALSVRMVSIVLFGVKLYKDGDDPATYLCLSEQLAVDGHITEGADVAFTFPHLFVFSIILLPVVKFVGTNNLIVSIYLTFLSCCSLLLLFDTASHIIGRVKSFSFAIIMALLPSQILLGRTITHEIAFVLFFSIALWLYFRVIPRMSKNWIKIILYILFCAFLAVSALVNAAGLIGMIAVVLYFAFESIKKHISQKEIIAFFVKSVCIILVYFIMNTSLSILQKNVSTLMFANHTSPIIWTLYIGANYNNEGAWDIDNANDLLEINPVQVDSSHISNDKSNPNISKSEIDSLQFDLVKSRYKYLFMHTGVLCKLLYNKYDKIWHGFFYPLYSERLSSKCLFENGLSNSLMHLMLLSVQYSVELILAVTTLLWFLKKNKGIFSFDNGLIFLIKLFLIGMTILLLIAECREKYIISINAFVAMIQVYYCSLYFKSYNFKKIKVNVNSFCQGKTGDGSVS